MAPRTSSFYVRPDTSNSGTKHLAHGERDKIRAAYNRAEYWEERVTMAQWWSDHLDTLRDSAQIIPLPPKLSTG